VIALLAKQPCRRRQRSIAIALVLVALVVLFYAVTLVKGPAVLVCNHVSFMDALVIGGSVRRPVRFVMDHNIFRIPVLGFIFRTAHAIPIAPAREDADAKLSLSAARTTRRG